MLCNQPQVSQHPRLIMSPKITSSPVRRHEVRCDPYLALLFLLLTRGARECAGDQPYQIQAYLITDFDCWLCYFHYSDGELHQSRSHIRSFLDWGLVAWISH